LPRNAAVTKAQLLRWLLLLSSFLGLARHFVSVIVFWQNDSLRANRYSMTFAS